MRDAVQSSRLERLLPEARLEARDRGERDARMQSRRPSGRRRDVARHVEKVERKKNTDEMGVIVIKVPQVEEEEEVKLEVTDMDGEEKTEIVKKLVDEDQGGSAIVIQGRDVSGVKIVDAR